MSEIFAKQIETIDKDTDRKVALVTGSASGIGANVAFDLASSGYFIIVTGRDEQKLNKVVAKCNKISLCSAMPFKADLLDLKQVDKLIQFIKLKFKRLDVLVNNACYRGDLHKNIYVNNDNNDNRQAYFDFQQVMHINVSIPMYLTHQCVIPMRQLQQRQSDTIIVNISSIASRVAVPLHSYSISKACLSEMSHQLAKLSQSSGIYSIAISPGPILTEERPHHEAMSSLTLMNRVGTTQEISDLVLFAIQNARMFNGQELDIDGGYLAKQRQVTGNDGGNSSFSSNN